MTKIAIIVGSTRPARAGTAVARWVHEIAQQHGDADYELIDLKDVDLPPLDEDLAPMLGRYSRPHTHRWFEQISPFDGYVFVTPEYNHGMPAALKNAIDFLYAEWNNKACRADLELVAWLPSSSLRVPVQGSYADKLCTQPVSIRTLNR
jgi:NAD(P)H-dependent FMN reductase